MAAMAGQAVHRAGRPSRHGRANGGLSGSCRCSGHVRPAGV